jgi:hypothetical protein
MNSVTSASSQPAVDFDVSVELSLYPLDRA